jgi:hypothetical protein
MKRPENLIRNSLILLLLIAAGVASRFVLIDLPNVKPIAAIVLFAAFWFRSYWVAGLSLAVVMLVSNSGLDSCPWQVTAGVISGLIVAAFLGRRLGSRFSNAQEVASRPTTAIAQLFGSAFVMSLAFFVISDWFTASPPQSRFSNTLSAATCFSPQQSLAFGMQLKPAPNHASQRLPSHNDNDVSNDCFCLAATECRLGSANLCRFSGSIDAGNRRRQLRRTSKGNRFHRA